MGGHAALCLGIYQCKTRQVALTSQGHLVHIKLPTHGSAHGKHTANTPVPSAGNHTERPQQGSEGGTGLEQPRPPPEAGLLMPTQRHGSPFPAEPGAAQGNNVSMPCPRLLCN